MISKKMLAARYEVTVVKIEGTEVAFAPIHLPQELQKEHMLEALLKIEAEWTKGTTLSSRKSFWDVNAAIEEGYYLLTGTTFGLDSVADEAIAEASTGSAR